MTARVRHLDVAAHHGLERLALPGVEASSRQTARAGVDLRGLRIGLVLLVEHRALRDRDLARGAAPAAGGRRQRRGPGAARSPATRSLILPSAGPALRRVGDAGWRGRSAGLSRSTHAATAIRRDHDGKRRGRGRRCGRARSAPPGRDGVDARALARPGLAEPAAIHRFALLEAGSGIAGGWTERRRGPPRRAAAEPAAAAAPATGRAPAGSSTAVEITSAKRLAPPLLGLDAVDRVVERHALAGDVALGERRIEVAQLLHQRRAGALVDRAAHRRRAFGEGFDGPRDEG